jgi:heterodisulfide reductase subunit C
MGKWFDRLKQDVRFHESLKACINCGTCTAICPAASFYDYDPREIVDALQSGDEEVLVGLLTGDGIWYCGQCMSCKTRCPRGNTPGLLISALRNLSIESGMYMESARGRQMYVLKKIIGDTVLATGYCVHADGVDPLLFPEHGPVWEWVMKNRPEVYNRFGDSYNRPGNGVLRAIPGESMEELRRIFEVTGTSQRFREIEKDAAEYAATAALDYDENLWNEYFLNQYSHPPSCQEARAGDSPGSAGTGGYSDPEMNG